MSRSSRSSNVDGLRARRPVASRASSSVISRIADELRDIERARRRAGTLIATGLAAVLGVSLLVVGLWAASATRAQAHGSESAAARTRGFTPAAPSAPKPSAAPKLAPKPTPAPAAKPKLAVQRLSIAIGAAGYEPSSVTVRAGVPVEITVARGEGCAAGFSLPELGLYGDNSAGPVTVRVPALKRGSYRFTCGMEMVSGTLIAK